MRIQAHINTNFTCICNCSVGILESKRWIGDNVCELLCFSKWGASPRTWSLIIDKTKRSLDNVPNISLAKMLHFSHILSSALVKGGKRKLSVKGPAIRQPPNLTLCLCKSPFCVCVKEHKIDQNHGYTKCKNSAGHPVSADCLLFV